MNTLHVYRWECPKGMGPCGDFDNPRVCRLNDHVVVGLWMTDTSRRGYPGIVEDLPHHFCDNWSRLRCATLHSTLRHWWPKWARRLARTYGFSLVRYTMRKDDVIVGLSGHQVFIEPSAALARTILVSPKEG